MKFSLSWLMQHLETEADAASVAAKLTELGLEVEGIEDKSAALRPFLVAHVVEAVKHPNADKLRVCKVDAGAGIVQVVCGAPNVRTGMKGIFAPPGTHIPGTGLDLKTGNIRGIDSNGMLCSARELGLGNDHDGIIELPDDAPVGLSFAAYHKLDDPIIEIKVTPDRGDCLGVFGIARDLSASGFGRLKPLTEKRLAGSFESPIQWQIAEDATKACPLVGGRYFRNVKNGPSPQWLQDRLIAIGLRPISALVDITNFVTFDLGRPLHVFDADKVKGNLVMRQAKAGEDLLALDGKTYQLAPSMIVIADDNGPAAIGGIMGGEATGCQPGTTNMFLEVALFDAITVAKAGRALGILSDARYRFERGVDPASVEWGLDVATRLVLEICGGEVSEISRAGTMPVAPASIAFRPSRVAALGGVDVPADRQRAIFTALGFKAAESSTQQWSVTPPTWRPDVEGEADLVEEILRVNGFDTIPTVSLPRMSSLPEMALAPAQKRTQTTRRLLAQRGLSEAVTFSFMPSKIARLFAPGSESVLFLANPISADLDAMRPSILGTLLEAAARNASRGFADLGLFEIGPVFTGTKPKDQLLVAAGIHVGKTPRHWLERQRPFDAFDAKADVLALLGANSVPIDNLQIEAIAPGYFHPGQSAQMRLGPNVLAKFGAIHPRILASLGIKGSAVGFEIFLDRLPQPRIKGSARPLLNAAPFQPIERDFAFVVDAGIAAEKLVKAAKNADKALIVDVTLFDVFSGEAIGAGKKSVALSVTLQPRERTLTDAEIESVSARIVAEVNKATGAELRK